MKNHIYETHRLSHSLLPFIFHKSFVITGRHSLPNWHENIELLYCIGGRGTILCNREQYTFAPGDIFVVNANLPHSISSQGSVMYCCLIIDNCFFETNGLPISTLHFKNCIRDKEMTARFEQIRKAFDTDEADICAIAGQRHAVLGLCCALCAHYVTEKPKEVLPSANEHIKNAMHYIRSHISKPITLHQIEKHVGISKYHLSREFKAFTGKTIVETINLIRCSEAKALIEGGMSVSAAARSCGFQNLSYFTRTFKRYYNSLPSEFAVKDRHPDIAESLEMLGC